jgi:hypothetical protein
MKIRPVGPEMFHADGWKDRRTDMTKLIVSFAILRRCLTTEGNLYYWIVLFFRITEQSPPYTNMMEYIPLMT